MGLSTVEPSGTTGTGGYTLTGAASAHIALSDDDDASYLSRAGVVSTGAVQVEIADPVPAIPATAQIRSVRPRLRYGQTFANLNQACLSVHVDELPARPTSPECVAPTGSTAPTTLQMTPLAKYGASGEDRPWTVDDMTRLLVVLSAESLGNDPNYTTRFYDVDLDLAWNEVPVVTVVPPPTDSSRPTLTMTYVDPEGDAKERHEWRVYERPAGGWAGFDPNTTTEEPVWSTGPVVSSALSVTPDVPLANLVNHRAYARAADTTPAGYAVKWSGWAFAEFTIVADVPRAARIVTATPDPDAALVALDVGGQDNFLDTQDANLEGVGVGNWTGTSITVVDRSVGQASEGAASLLLRAAGGGHLLASVGPLPGGLVLAAADAWWMARDYAGVGDLLDLSGNGRHLAFPGGVNNPIWLAYTGVKYAYFTGVAGNFASTPDSPANSVTGDLDVRIDVAPDDWTPSSIGVFVAKWGASAGSNAFIFRHHADGNLSFLWDEAGVTRSQTTNVPLSFANGERRQVRVTIDVDNGAGGRTITFYTRATDTDAWAVHQAFVQSGGATSISDAAWAVEVGARGTGATERLAGKVYRAEVRNGIGGPVVASFDPTLAAEPWVSFVAATGETWTLTRSTGSANNARLTLVDRPILLFGGTRRLQRVDDPVFDVATGQSFTALFCFRHFGTTGGGAMIGKRLSLSSTVDRGWMLGRASNVDTGFAEISDGTTESARAPSIAGTEGIVNVFGIRRDTGADTFASYVNGAISSTGDVTVGTMENAEQLRIGTSGSGATGGSFAFLGAAFFRWALSATEMDAVAAELRARSLP